jgi:acyl-CoA reductase-like NAD-dependent aldehyde dehydrogenase
MATHEQPTTVQPHPAAGAHGVRAAVSRARAAQPAWQALGFAGRARFMRRALAILAKEQERFIAVIGAETGRPRTETMMMEILPACDSLAYHAKHAERILADRKEKLHLLIGKKLVITYKPLGVIGIITPWNGPFILPLNPSVQALMAGNTVVVKPSDVTPRSAHLVADLFREAGLPDGVFQVVDGDGSAGAALIDSGVDKISFTGSVRTGRLVGEACGRNLIPCTLELGGKDPMIVCGDAVVERAAHGAVFGSLMNSGQVCCSTERIYVVDSVYEEFVRRVVDKVVTLRQGTEGEFDVGPMIWPRQLEVIERHMDDARKKGAQILAGGRRNPKRGERCYEPTVVAGVTHDMELMREETFGPIIAIMRVRDEDEAVRLANDTQYGLSATVWTGDPEKGIALAKRIETGSVCVNECPISYGALEAPFGGRKASGVGQVNGEEGLRGYCHAMAIIVDPGKRKEEPVWYPYTEAKARMLQKVVRWVYGTPLGRLLS